MRSRSRFSQSGQASVEAVAVVPFVVLVALLAWQLVLAGHALWLSANAARVGARAELVGRDARTAALSALPSSLEHGVRVVRDASGRVRVRVRVPWVLSGSPSPLAVSAGAGPLGAR